MKMLRILLADDHAVVRLGLKSLLESEDDMIVVGMAKNGREAVRLAQTERPDVIVMDLMMPQMDGVEATAAILSERPETKIIVLTTYGSADNVAHALQAGAVGAITKTEEDATLVTAIRRVAAGRAAVSPEIRRQLAESPPVPKLSARQQEILSSITRGLTTKEIAFQLGISSRSVDEHVNAIIAKIGAANRTEAVAIALRKHLLKL